MYRGTCHGGPLDGTEWESRFPKGFLLVNRPRGEIVIYDRHVDGTFTAREVDGTVVLREYVLGRRRAALESNYDVWPHDEERMPPW